MPEQNEPQVDEAQIKAALTAARDLSEARAARRQYWTPRQADPSESSEVRANRRTLENLLASSFAKAGFEVDKFDEVLARDRAALGRLAETKKTEAVERSSSVKESLRRDVESRRKVLEQLADAAPPEASPGAARKSYKILDSPFLIVPSSQFSLRPSGGSGFTYQYQVEPWNSWAKITLHADSSGEALAGADVSFVYIWENPSDASAVIDVDAYLVLNGHCQAGSSGGNVKSDRFSELRVGTSLNPFEYWNQPPTSPMFQVHQAMPVLTLATNTGGWFDPGAIEVKDLWTSIDLRYTSYSVPPHGVVVFEVTFGAGYHIEEGSVYADFASGDYEILCPAVLIGIHS